MPHSTVLLCRNHTQQYKDLEIKIHFKKRKYIWKNSEIKIQYIEKTLAADKWCVFLKTIYGIVFHRIFLRIQLLFIGNEYSYRVIFFSNFWIDHIWRCQVGRRKKNVFETGNKKKKITKIRIKNPFLRFFIVTKLLLGQSKLYIFFQYILK